MLSMPSLSGLNRNMAARECWVLVIGLSMVDHAFDRPTIVNEAGAGGVARPDSSGSFTSTLQPRWRLRPLSERLPGVPQVACFDTSFHRGHARVGSNWCRCRADSASQGVERYGFHGISYEYIASVLPEVAPEIASGRVIVAHSRQRRQSCALKDGKSVDSTMGFTAVGWAYAWGRGRARSIPASFFISSKTSASPPKRWKQFSTRNPACSRFRKSATTCATFWAGPNLKRRLAVDYFVYRAAKEIGALAAALGGLDALVFTAGIGENSAEIRQRICQASAWLGIELNEAGECRSEPADFKR